jgi:O-antigen/teichoic acid export membrane protein
VTESPPPSSRPHDPLQQIARGSVLSGVGAVAAAIGGIGLTLLVTRSFIPELAGTFFAGTTFLLIVGQLAQLGTDVGLVRYLSAHSATGQNHRLGETLRIALTPVFVAACVCAVLMYVGAATIAGWIGNDQVLAQTTSIVQALAFFVPVVALYTPLLAATRGGGSMRVSVGVDSLFRTVAQPVLLGATVLLGWGPTAAAVAWSLPYALGVVISSVVLRRRFARARARLVSAAGGASPQPPPKKVFAREFWSFTAARAVSGAVVMVWRRFDVLLVAAISGPADAAIYTAATRFLVVGSLAIQAVQMTVSPQLGRMFAQRDVEGARRIYSTSTLWTMTFAWPMYIVTASAVSLVIPVFGATYDAGTSAVVVLSASMLVATACGSVDAVLLMSGNSVLSLGNAVLTLLVNVGLDLLLIPRFGILGAASGWAFSIALRNILALVQINKLMHMWPFSRPSGAVVAASVACFAIVPGLLTWADTSNLWLLLSLAVGAVAYAGWLYRFRRRLQLDTFVQALTRRGRAARPGEAGAAAT